MGITYLTSRDRGVAVSRAMTRHSDAGDISIFLALVKEDVYLLMLAVLKVNVPIWPIKKLAAASGGKKKRPALRGPAAVESMVEPYRDTVADA
jgi:hypothetical protein